MTTVLDTDAFDSPAPAREPVTVFACGDPYRGDDALAFAVVRELPVQLGERVRVVDEGTLDARMLLELPDDVPCVVVDAVAGVAPGELVTMPLERLAAAARDRALRGETPSTRSSHLMSIESALGLAAMLLGRPVRGTFVGIGVRDCTLGAPLSADVLAALPAAIAAVTAAVARHEAEVQP
jgi:hydrogenase maturation protease